MQNKEVEAKNSNFILFLVSNTKPELLTFSDMQVSAVLR